VKSAKAVIARSNFCQNIDAFEPNKTGNKLPNYSLNALWKTSPQLGYCKVKPHHGGQGYVTPIDSIGYKAANSPCRNFGVPAIPVRSG
jgi:hypothetical protein